MLDTGTSGRKDTGDEKEMRVRSSSSVLARMRRLPAAYQVIVVLLRPMLRVLFRRDWRGMEHLPEGGAVIAPNHLSYIGDATIGSKVNVGAGTITCNYDGFNKWPTIIGDGVFIGSGTMLVAPVRIGAGATIGAGSTITRSTPDGKLTLERAKQTTIDGWQPPTKFDAATMQARIDEALKKG